MKIPSDLIHDSKEYRRLVVWCWFHVKLGSKLYLTRSQKIYPTFFQLEDMVELNKLPVKDIPDGIMRIYHGYQGIIYMPSARRDIRNAAILDALHYEQLRIRASLTSRL